MIAGAPSNKFRSAGEAGSRWLSAFLRSRSPLNRSISGDVHGSPQSLNAWQRCRSSRNSAASISFGGRLSIPSAKKGSRRRPLFARTSPSRCRSTSANSTLCCARQRSSSGHSSSLPQSFEKSANRRTSQNTARGADIHWPNRSRAKGEGSSRAAISTQRRHEDVQKRHPVRIPQPYTTPQPRGPLFRGARL